MRIFDEVQKMSVTTTETKYTFLIDLSQATKWEKRLVRAKIEETQAHIQAMYDFQKEATQ